MDGRPSRSSFAGKVRSSCSGCATTATVCPTASRQGCSNLSIAPPAIARAQADGDSAWPWSSRSQSSMTALSGTNGPPAAARVSWSNCPVQPSDRLDSINDAARLRRSTQKAKAGNADDHSCPEELWATTPAGQGDQQFSIRSGVVDLVHEQLEFGRVHSDDVLFLGIGFRIHVGHELGKRGDPLGLQPIVLGREVAIDL